MPPREEDQRTNCAFATTMWSVVLTAGNRSHPDAAQALERLCRTYWRPIYAYLRRDGQSPADAEDFTQGFLVSLLARNSLAAVCPERGRFRSFLFAALRNFICDQKDKANAEKRGGGQRIISLDGESPEAFYARQATSGETPQNVFERQWAQIILDRAQAQLRRECEAAGKSALYQDLGPDDQRARSHADIAAAHRMSENAVRLAAFRLRQRYQELVRAEVRETVASETEVEEEIRELLRVFSQ